ncbi:uncharacterized protein DS421_18g611720 [Arachis hypogaea]|nr:uncharacterized protein DS421_18g611720 [Arachis hypogaea]
MKDFSLEKSWWYKSCNVCPLAMREEGDGYKYSRCKTESQNFTPRYSLNLKVADEESYASFIVYETVGSEYLNISVAELRTKHIMRGGNRIEFPEELSKFKNKTFLFKVYVKLENINSFQLDAFFPANSDMITLLADYSDMNKVGDNQPEIESSKSITPIMYGQNSSSTDESTATSGGASEVAQSENWISQPTHDAGEDYNFSATKTRKVAKE